MKSLVVYESLWGNTAAVARAVAEGLGPDARAVSTAEAPRGTALMASTSSSPARRCSASSCPARRCVKASAPTGERPPRRRPLRPVAACLDRLAAPAGGGRSAAFDTQVKGPFGKGAPEITAVLAAAGYEPVGEPVGFVVKGKYGPLKDGELNGPAPGARSWRGLRGPSQKPEALRQSLPGRRRGALLPGSDPPPILRRSRRPRNRQARRRSAAREPPDPRLRDRRPRSASAGPRRGP